ncbi:MAG: hypothetical protein ACP5ML_00780 [Fervidicoccus sp.]
MLRKAIIIAVLIVAILTIVYFSFERAEAESQSSYITFKGVPKLYGNYDTAVIIRLDDFVADPYYISHGFPVIPGKSTKAYQEYELDLINYLINNHPEARLVFGIVTSDNSGENNTYIWNLYREVVEEYGWEAASHTRYHQPPPRNITDILGSLKDIEGNISGYTVHTYIPPYGKVTKNELSILRENGIKIVMSDKPYEITLPKNWYDVHISLKMSDRLPWIDILRLELSLAKYTKNGCIIIYTHPTSFDWKDPEQMIKAFNEMLNIVEKGNNWITTPYELYRYSEEQSSVSIKAINSTSFYVYFDRKLNFSSQDILPVTLVFQVSGKVTDVTANGIQLQKLNSFGYVPKEGYLIRGNLLYINIVPPKSINIVIDK